jgi:CheY-like chemotaxis protein
MDDQQQRQPMTQAHKKHKLLIYKDILLNTPWLRQWIAREKILTVVFEKGSQIMDKVVQERPTVILMSVQMSGMGGLDCAYMIRADDVWKDVRLVVISDVFAYSLVHQAQVAGVDLFTDPYHMPVKVLRFLKHTMGFSQKKKVASNPAHMEEISQRLRDRYPLDGKVEVSHGDQRIDGRFENISMEGALVHLTQMPPHGAKVHLRWTLPNRETYAMDALSVRQSMVFEPKDEYVWVVGVKFLEMSPHMMGKLDALIQTIARFYEKKFEFIDFQRIREMLAKKEAYFAEILQGQRQPSSIVDRSLSKVKAYERHAYGGNDPASRGIARLMALRMTARVLRKALDWVQIHPAQGLAQCLPLITQLMEVIDQTEEHAEELLLKATQDDDKELRRQLIESSNLLSDQKDKLVQYYYQRCANMEPEPGMEKDHQKMMDRHQTLQSYAHFLETEEKDQKQRSLQHAPIYQASQATLREKKQQEKKKFRSQLRRNLISDLLKYTAAAVVLATFLAFGMRYIRSFVKPETLQLSLMVKQARLIHGQALEVHTTASAWSELTLEQKVKIMDELEVYLTRMAYYQAKVLDEQDNALAGVMSTYDPEHLVYYPLLFE